VQRDSFPLERGRAAHKASAKAKSMLYKCANEACSAPFRRLREGKLFQVETEYFAQGQSGGSPRRTRPWRRVEHYWLCDACSVFITLTFDRERGVITVPLPDGIGKRTVTLVCPPKKSEVFDHALHDPLQETVQQTLREVAK
jgi:hypothetical protein